MAISYIVNNSKEFIQISSWEAQQAYTKILRRGVERGEHIKKYLGINFVICRIKVLQEQSLA